MAELQGTEDKLQAVEDGHSKLAARCAELEAQLTGVDELEVGSLLHCVAKNVVLLNTCRWKQHSTVQGIFMCACVTQRACMLHSRQ